MTVSQALMRRGNLQFTCSGKLPVVIINKNEDIKLGAATNQNARYPFGVWYQLQGPMVLKHHYLTPQTGISRPSDFGFEKSIRNY